NERKRTEVRQKLVNPCGRPGASKIRQQQQRNWRNEMNRYRSPHSRVAVGFAAVTMTALIIGLAVVVPASMPPANLAPPPAQAAMTPRSIDIVPARIDVFGVRSPKVISMQPIGTAAAAGRQS